MQWWGWGAFIRLAFVLTGNNGGALTRRQRRDGEETTCSFEQVVVLISHLTSLQGGRRS